MKSVAVMKTLGAQTAKLFQSLNDASRTVFSLDDAVAVLGSPRNIVSNLLAKAQTRGVVTRLRSGLYSLVPFDMGSFAEYAGDPYVIACRLAEPEGHLSHGTAMAVHAMTLQPRLLTTVTCLNPSRRTIWAGGYEFRLVSVSRAEIFGVDVRRLNHGQKISVTDLERTIIDCLRRTDLCGGYSEVDIGVWMVAEKVDVDRLVEYAVRLGVKSVIARTGFLLDSCGLGEEHHRRLLQSNLTKTYHLLDPMLESMGDYVSEWRIRRNISAEEIRAARNS
jgi:predicted transcriptional regulator of viral defense system